MCAFLGINLAKVQKNKNLILALTILDEFMQSKIHLSSFFDIFDESRGNIILLMNDFKFLKEYELICVESDSKNSGFLWITNKGMELLELLRNNFSNYY